MIKVRKIKPMFTSIVTTMDKYEEDIHTEGGIIDVTKQQGTVKEFQKVLAVGSAVKDIKVGDLVCINPSRFAVRKHQPGSMKDGVVTDNPVVKYVFPVIALGDKNCLLLQDRDVEFVVEEWEETSETGSLINPANEIIT